MTKPARISYAIIILTIVLAAAMGMETPLLAILFSYFALQKLSFGRSRTLAVFLFVILMGGVGYGVFYFFDQAVPAFPRIAETAIASAIKIATHYELTLSFSDWESFREMAVKNVAERFGYFSKGATLFGKQLVMLVVGVVSALGLYVTTRVELGNPNAPKDNLYSLVAVEVVERFRSFYRSFATVMGAQIIISAINTSLTAIFIFWVGLPYAGLVVAITFFCGLLPIIGNLISNTVIVTIGLTVSPNLGLAALAFLIVLHKLEYFLNSKIIGERIKNPMWLTLLALVLAERLMGIPGMILAPVLLHYIRTETSKIPVEASDAVPCTPTEPLD